MLALAKSVYLLLLLATIASTTHTGLAAGNLSSLDEISFGVSSDGAPLISFPGDNGQRVFMRVAAADWIDRFERRGHRNGNLAVLDSLNFGVASSGVPTISFVGDNGQRFFMNVPQTVWLDAKDRRAKNRRELDRRKAKSPNETPSAKSINTGTGFFISPDGEFVTCAHVIRNCNVDSIRVTTVSGREYIVERLIMIDDLNDLAVLKIAISGTPYLPMRSAKYLSLGTNVFTMGFPVSELLGRDVKYTDGAISSLSGLKGKESLLQITIPIQPGNSGGPVITESGFVVGVVTSTAAIMPFLESTGSLPQNVNWAVKSDYLMHPCLQKSAPASATKAMAIKRAQDSVCRITASRK